MTDTTPVVLVADDEPSTLALVAAHVRGKGYEVIEASDGDEAWQHAQDHLPDLIVLDVMMPGMSGWEVCRKVRDSVSLAHTAIVMLTGIGEHLNEMTSPLYGADAYIDKPFEFSDLDSRIDEALAARRGTMSATKSEPTTNGKPRKKHGASDLAGATPQTETQRAPKKRTAKKAAQAAKSPEKAKVDTKATQAGASKPATAKPPAKAKAAATPKKAKVAKAKPAPAPKAKAKPPPAPKAKPAPKKAKAKAKPAPKAKAKAKPAPKAKAKAKPVPAGAKRGPAKAAATSKKAAKKAPKRR